MKVAELFDSARARARFFREQKQQFSAEIVEQLLALATVQSCRIASLEEELGFWKRYADRSDRLLKAIGNARDPEPGEVGLSREEIIHGTEKGIINT